MNLSNIMSCVLITIFLFLIIFFFFKGFFFNKRKKIIIKRLKNEDFSKVNDYPNQKNYRLRQNNINKNLKAYFKNVQLYEFDLKSVFKFINKKTKKGLDNTEIAWSFFILLTTSVLSNKSNGLVSEAVKSIYNVFNKSKKLLLESKESNLITDVILKIMNLKIRPILTNSRSLPKKDNHSDIDDSKLNSEQIDNFWNSINELKRELIDDKYLNYIALLSLSNIKQEDIIKLVNY